MSPLQDYGGFGKGYAPYWCEFLHEGPASFSATKVDLGWRNFQDASNV